MGITKQLELLMGLYAFWRKLVMLLVQDFHKIVAKSSFKTLFKDSLDSKGSPSYFEGKERNKRQDCKYSEWNNGRSLVTVRHDFMCDRQDSFSASHNNGQVFKFQ